MHAHHVARSIVVALLLSLAGCSAAASPATSPAPGAGIAVSDAWVRAVASASETSGGYLTIANSGGQDDALTGAASPVAASVEVHETSMDSSGMAGMHPVDSVPVGAGQTVKLQPGGYHLMIMGLTKPLKAGDTVELDLTFQRAGKVVVQAEVRQS